jgi:uncharacterized membrane protein
MGSRHGSCPKPFCPSACLSMKENIWDKAAVLTNNSNYVLYQTQLFPISRILKNFPKNNLDKEIKTNNNMWYNNHIV